MSIDVLGYINVFMLWIAAMVILIEAGKMKYGIIPCLVNWIAWKWFNAERSKCLEWFLKRPFYIFMHPMWMLCISLALSLLSSLYRNMFHVRPEDALIFSILLWFFVSIFLYFILKHVRKHEPYK